MYVWQDMEISNISNYRDLKFQRDALMRVREREGGGGVVVVCGGGGGWAVQWSDIITGDLQAVSNNTPVSLKWLWKITWKLKL